MELPRLVTLLGIVVIALVLGVAAAVLWRPRRRLAVGLLAASLVVTGGGATVAARVLGIGERHTAIVAGAVSDAEPGFTAEVTHERLAYDGVRYTFRTDVPHEKLLALLEATYPAGTVEGGTFAVVLSGTRYTVADVDAEARVYDLLAETATVSHGDTVSTIAFPPGAVAGNLVTVGTAQPLLIAGAELARYLESLGTATHTEDGVIIPTSSGARLRLTLSDDTLTATFARRIG